MADVRINNVKKIYPNGVLAVEDFSLNVKDGEFVILIGPSGCGKSTMLKLIAGLEPLSEGEVYIGDELVNNVAAKDRNIAMVFQNYALYPHMTVYENLAFGLVMKKLPKALIKQRVQEAAELLDIVHLLKRKPRALSGGQRQRVALGRAMVREPKVFLFDEPLSNIEASLRMQMRTELAKLHARLSATFIYVTHDQTEAMMLGQKIVVMNEGRVMQSGTPQTIYNSPNHKFVAEFFGSPPMNIVEGKLELSGQQAFAVIAGQRLLIDKTRAQQIDSSAYGQSVYFGIRPKDISIPKDDISSCDVLNVKTMMCERRGIDTLVYFDMDGASMTARFEEHCTIRMGDSIRVCFDTSKLHVFDMQTQMTMIQMSN